MRRPFVALALAAALAGAGLLSLGCRGQASREPTVGLDLPAGKSHVLKGELLEGAECPMLLTAGGHRVSLSGDLGGFKPGDRVCARGRLAEVSFCMAGEATLTLEAIGPESECP